MRYFETKEQQPERVLTYEQTESFRYKLLKVFTGLLILGFGVMFVGWIYRKQWANFRVIQSYGALLCVFSWVVILAICKSFGMSISKFGFNKFKSVLKNEAENTGDPVSTFRKQISNTLYHQTDSWTLYPSVYKVNPEKHVDCILVGPAGVYGINPVTTDPKKKKEFIDPKFALIDGTNALSKKLGVPVNKIVLIRRQTRNYKIEDEDIKLYTFTELSSYIDSREPIYTEEEVEALNKQIAAITNANTSVRCE